MSNAPQHNDPRASSLANAPVICNHSSYVTGNGGDFNFSWCKAPVNALHCGSSHVVVKTQLKVPLKSWQVNVKFLPGVKTWEQKPGTDPALWGWCCG